MGLGEAAKIGKTELDEDREYIRKLRGEFLEYIRERLSHIHLNGGDGVPGCINISIEGVEGESLIMGLGDLDISSG